MNWSIHRKFREYLREHGVFVPKKKNMHVFTELELDVEEAMEWLTMQTDQVKHLRLAAEVGSLPVEESFGLKQHIGFAPRNF